MCNYPGPMMVSIGDSVPEETWNRIKLQCALNLYGRIAPVVTDGIRNVGEVFVKMGESMKNIDFSHAQEQIEKVTQTPIAGFHSVANPMQKVEYGIKAASTSHILESLGVTSDGRHV
ncbi:gp059 [Rhodococcus phage ReqiPepy6]|uniref:Gp059 n=1 Tax=Rhodococcus phage ReqiPepy6 TaxID=691965 RepID=D4P7H0_9CAUD|nr:gp059 [Rhodococcus phage ReqiPepy6]ADD80950.1 gp059 [Rhodococcus phage ReqiPepy6]